MAYVYPSINQKEHEINPKKYEARSTDGLASLFLYGGFIWFNQIREIVCVSYIRRVTRTTGLVDCFSSRHQKVLPYSKIFAVRE